MAQVRHRQRIRWKRYDEIEKEIVRLSHELEHRPHEIAKQLGELRQELESRLEELSTPAQNRMQP